MRLHLVTVLTIAALLTACASCPSTQTLAVVEAKDPDSVKNCKLLGTLTDSSMFSMNAAEMGVHNAMYDIKDQATELHATHVLQVSITAGVFNTRVYANAYDCNVKG